MGQLLLVMLGGALGSGARFLTSRVTVALFGIGFPWGTLAVNLIGGFAMGALAGALARASVPQEDLRLLLAVGVLGGFTTFSAFSLDAVLMIERGEIGVAAAYVLASVVGSIVALFGGLTLVRVAA